MRRWLVVGSAVAVAVVALAGGAGAVQPSTAQAPDENRFQAVILGPLVAPSAGPVAAGVWMAPSPEHRASAGGPEGAPGGEGGIGSGRDIPPTSPSATATAARPAPTEPASSGPVAVSGTASWYPASGMIGAVHSWSWGDQPYRVTVCAGRCIVVTVSDYCAGCVGPRLIDLSDDAFRLLAPLSAGIVSIEMR